MTRLFALALSVAVHVCLVVVWWDSAPPPPAPRVAPVEVELTFRAAQPRRVAPTPPPPPAPPRVAKGGGGGKKALAAHAPTPIPIAAIDERGGVAVVPPGGDGRDAGLGDDGEDEVTTVAPPPPPLPPVRTEATLLTLPAIAYPERARVDEIEGVVVLWITVGADGRVQEAQVRSSPDTTLSEAATSAMLRAQFRPATLGAQPIAAQFEYRYRFELE